MGQQSRRGSFYQSPYIGGFCSESLLRRLLVFKTELHLNPEEKKKKVILTYQEFLKSANHRSRMDTSMGSSLELLVDIPRRKAGPRVSSKNKEVGSPILCGKPLTSTPENSCGIWSSWPEVSGWPDLWNYPSVTNLIAGRTESAEVSVCSLTYRSALQQCVCCCIRRESTDTGLFYRQSSGWCFLLPLFSVLRRHFARTLACCGTLL